MPQTVRDVMTPDPEICPATTSLADAARIMRDHDVGDVLVERDGRLCGIVTDRDVVVRAIAEGRDPAQTKLGDICTRDLVVVSPDDTVGRVVEIMREQALRRVPVCEQDRAVGIVSLGDLAQERDPDSALADISAAPPNS